MFQIEGVRMRLGVGSAWTSLTGLAVLLVAAGCQMPVPGEGPDVDPENPDPNQYRPGTDPNNPDRPPGNHQQPPLGGMPTAPRKLALDLSGVAGFAILDDEGQSGSAGLGALGGASLDGASSDSGATLRLASSLTGQVLTRSLDGLSREQLLRNGLGVPGLAQEDISGGAAPAPTGDSAAPLPNTTPGTTPESSAGEQAGLLKIMEDGQVAPALVELESEPAPTASEQPRPPEGSEPSGAAAPPEAGPSGGTGAPGAPTASPTGLTGAPREPLPRVTALGLSPDGSVYVLFQHGFVYRQPTAEEVAAGGTDLYGPQSPFRCQLFRADGSWHEGAQGAGSLAELECVTNEHEVPTWDTRRVMQFDASGKLYFRAITPANPMGVFLQYDPLSKALSEKVNANICWRDVQVTPRGSLFYTGSSAGGEGACSGTSFFRYVSTDNRLTEIARDWWNFKYVAEQDPGDPDNERIIFYGPDPNSTGTYSWDSACLYRYNPAITTPAERTEKLVECYRDGYSYVNGQNLGPALPQPPTSEELPEYQARCESAGQLFIGGDGVSALSQLADGTLFVVGRFQRKLPGQLGCGLQVQSDHCAVLGTGMQGDALDGVNTSEEACEAAGHTWVFTGQGCSNGVDESPEGCTANEATWNSGPIVRYYDMTGPSCAATGEGITRNFLDCRTIGQQASFSQEVNGLAYLVPASESEPSQLVLLSDPAERVERYWPIPGASGSQLFYATYSGGQYSLRMATQVQGEGGVTIERRSLLDDYEVYNLQRDPANPSRVLFDALEFSTNSYLFGSIDPTLPTPQDVQDSLQLVDGVSGRVETLIVLPNF